MKILNIKPISINSCFQGRRYKTKKYDKYIYDVLSMLPMINVPKTPLKLTLVAHISKLSDLDNICKPILDILVKKYGFDDRDIYEIQMFKVLAKKGQEKILWSLESYSELNLSMEIKSNLF